MIEVKGTRTEPRDGDPAQRYVLKEAAERSKTPLFAGALLAAVGLYLKSIFPSAGSVEQETVPAGTEGAEKPLQEAAAVLPEAQGETETVEGKDERAGSSSSYHILDLQPSRSFSMIESPPFQFDQPMTLPEWPGFRTPSVLPLAANDNSGAAGSGGGGSGVGGMAEGELPDGSPLDDSPTDESTPDGDEDDTGETTGNRAPRVNGPVYLMDVVGCAVLVISLTDLLSDAQDPDGDSLTIRNLTSSAGTLKATEHGWIFEGEPNEYGPVMLTYQVSDGEFLVDQVAYFSVLAAPPIIGTAGDDILLGSMCADEIDGAAGDDIIDARAGNDVVLGSGGHDRIMGWGGDDAIFGGDGNDIVLAGLGDDHVSGGRGDDRLFGEDGDDIVFGDEGDDHVAGGAGADLLFGGTGDDRVEGGDGDDRLDGGQGDDRLFGEDGDDIVFGDEGDDHVAGGAGADLLFGGTGDDRIDGGDGDDRLDGGDGHDVIDAGEGDDHVAGGVGADLLFGGTGDDRVEGGDGDDRLDGGLGDDVLHGGDGNDAIDAGEGDDVILDGGGEDDVLAGDGDDHVVAALDAADDHYSGGEGCDVLDYSEAIAPLLIDLVAGRASGTEIGEDCVVDFEAVLGGYADDHFVIGGESIVITGGEGGDVFRFNAPDLSEATSVSFEVTDFQAGDRIRTSKYDLFDEVFKKLEDQFEKIYGENLDEDNVRIRYRDDRFEDGRRATIEADFNRDGTWEATIEVNNRHLVATVEAI